MTIFNKNKVVMYSDSLWTDCQNAKSFFADHNIKIKVKDISEVSVQNEMKKKFNRVMTPTIVINGDTIIGFEENLPKIKKLLGLDI